jgi:hypothetical protein
VCYPFLAARKAVLLGAGKAVLLARLGRREAIVSVFAWRSMLHFINILRERWEDRWQRGASDTLTILAMLSAVAVALLALFGVLD